MEGERRIADLFRNLLRNCREILSGKNPLAVESANFALVRGMWYPWHLSTPLVS
jgi:hypothetical protein